MDIKVIVRNYYNLFKRRFLYYKLWPYYYKKYSRRPIDEKKVVLAYSHIYKKMPDNLAVMKEYLEAKGYNCIVIDKAEGATFSNNKLINEVKKLFYGKEFFKAYGNAKALFLSDFFFLPMRQNRVRGRALFNSGTAAEHSKNGAIQPQKRNGAQARRNLINSRSIIHIPMSAFHRPKSVLPMRKPLAAVRIQ